MLRDAAILIRPHPQNAEQWRDFDSRPITKRSASGRVPAPIRWTADARADYFDSMFHSVAVVGVNTSALIESGIVGRPVFTVLADEFAGQQEGTLHFQHLKNVNGGLLTAAPSLRGARRAAGGGRARPAGRDERARAFVQAFVRPYGLDMPAAGRSSTPSRRRRRAGTGAGARAVWGSASLAFLMRPAWRWRRRRARPAPSIGERSRTPTGDGTAAGALSVRGLVSRIPPLLRLHDAGAGATAGIT